jgi:hypothetical protein
MRQLLWASVAAVGLAGGMVPGEASAQFYQRPQTTPFARPTISPYLNLFRQGGSFTQNYFGLVRPQQQYNQNIQQLQQQQNQLSQNLSATQAQVNANTQAVSSLLPTGQPVGFLTHGRYFMTLGRGGAGAPTAARGAAPLPRGGGGFRR